MEEKKVREISDKVHSEVDGLSPEKALGVLSVFLIAVIGVGLIATSGIDTSQKTPRDAPKEPDTGQNTSDTSNVKLTAYQKNFVDCPAEYLEDCTSLSKQFSSKVVYLKDGQNSNIILELPSESTKVEYNTKYDYWNKIG